MLGSKYCENLPKKPSLVGTVFLVCIWCGSTRGLARNTTQELLFSNYDKDVRPNDGVAPVLLKLDLYVESFANIAEANMEYTVFGYLRHYWTDKRFAGKSNKTIRLQGSTIEHVWTPDTYVSNSRESNMRVKDSESESVLEIYPNGGVFYSKGVKIVASCDMKLENFPMDTQKCMLIFGSYGHNTEGLIYKWEGDTVSVEKKSIAQFDMKRVQLTSYNVTYISGVHGFLSLTVINRAINLKFAGTFSILRVTFSFKRRIGYYVIQVFFPDILVVTISWIIFWLDQDDMGGRVGLGITTLLTIMFLLGSVNMSLPRVSYPKAIDWYLIGSFLFVFLVLMECILVYILRPRKPQRKNSNQKKVNGLEIDSINNLQDLPGMENIPLKQRDQHDFSNGEPVQSGVDNEMTGEAPTTTQKGFESSASCDCGKTVDRASRFLFPFVFVVFNVFYWWHFLIE